jgi:hypothetical protein
MPRRAARMAECRAPGFGYPAIMANRFTERI